jgi:UDP-N-acetylmuramoylalanine--D-glutamate ligase
MLLGGDGKGQDFSLLREPLARHARAVAVYGHDAELIGAALFGLDQPIEQHEDLVSACQWAFKQAQPGDAVLLSPACASLDQFRDYKHRAEVFVSQAQAWARNQGELT